MQLQQQQVVVHRRRRRGRQAALFYGKRPPALHFPGQQNIMHEDVGLLTGDTHAVTMRVKFDILSGALMGALDVMLSTTDGMQSNKGALDKLEANMQVNRHAIYKLGKETGATGNLPSHPAEWRQQAATVHKKGFSGS